LRLSVPLMLLAAVAGCATGHGARLAPPVEPVTPPPSWTAIDACADGDAEPWPGGDLLDGLVAEALAGNPDLAAAAARVAASAAVVRIVGAGRYPLVNAAFDAGRRKQNFIGLPVPGEGVPSSTATSYGVSLNVSWELDLWNRLGAGQRAALADADAAAAELEFARLSLAAQIAKAWYAVIESRQQVELAEETAKNRSAILRNAEARYQHGLSVAVDLSAARASVATSKAVAAARREQLDRSRRSLEILLGRYPSASLEMASVLPARTCVVPADLPADLVHRRPDLRAAELRLIASDGRLEAARAELRPQIRLTALGGTATRALTDLLSGDFGVWSLVGGIVQPIFAGGRLRAQVDQADALDHAAAADYAAVVLRAYGEVEAALAAEAMLRDREQHTAAAAAAESRTRSLLEERYRQGLVDVLALREAQRRELVAQSELLVVRRERLVNRIDLYLALGGSPSSPAATSPPKEPS